MNNCLLWALYRVFSRGGYLIARKSHYGWWPHFLWSQDLIHFEEFTPRRPNHHLPIPPPLYQGLIVRSGVTQQRTERSRRHWQEEPDQAA